MVIEKHCERTHFHNSKFLAGKNTYAFSNLLHYLCPLHNTLVYWLALFVVFPRFLHNSLILLCLSTNKTSLLSSRNKISRSQDEIY